MKEKNNNTCLLTFDIEEWFQVENLRSVISKEDWDKQTSTVAQNTHKILEILNKYQIPATFFILGWLAERYPQLVEEIRDSGQEVACHGYGHDLAYDQRDEDIVNDISHAKEILEKITERPVYGYRAPNFSINDRILSHLKTLGFLYDSSYCPVRLHHRYGTLNGLDEKIAPDLYKTDSGVFEIPVATVSIAGKNIPIGGGAYFRIYPLWLFKRFVSWKLKSEAVYNMYLHPWEFEPEQEQVKNIKFDYKFRHYYGLKKTANKFEKLIKFLKDKECIFQTMHRYVEGIGIRD